MPSIMDFDCSIIYIVLSCTHKSGHQCSLNRPIVVFVGVGRIAYLFIVIIVFLEGCCGGRPTERCTHVRTWRLTCVVDRPYNDKSGTVLYIITYVRLYTENGFFFFLLLPPTDTPYERPRSYKRRRENELQLFISLYCSICIIRHKHTARSDTYIHTCIRVYRRSNLRIWINYRLRNNNRTSFARMIDRPRFDHCRPGCVITGERPLRPYISISGFVRTCTCIVLCIERYTYAYKSTLASRPS